MATGKDGPIDFWNLISGNYGAVSEGLFRGVLFGKTFQGKPRHFKP